MTLPEVFYAVLSEKGPLTQSELVVCMMEAGYQTTRAPKTLRYSVELVLRKATQQLSSDTLCGCPVTIAAQLRQVPIHPHRDHQEVAALWGIQRL